MKKALITGITGQDGAYLAHLLLEKNYEVFGGIRRNSQDELHRLRVLKIHEKITFSLFYRSNRVRSNPTRIRRI